MKLLLELPRIEFVSLSEIFLHQLALVRDVISGGNNGPGQDETKRQHYLKKNGAVDTATIIVLTLCFVFATYSTIFYFAIRHLYGGGKLCT